MTRPELDADSLAALGLRPDEIGDVVSVALPEDPTAQGSVGGVLTLAWFASTAFGGQFLSPILGPLTRAGIRLLAAEGRPSLIEAVPPKGETLGVVTSKGTEDAVLLSARNPGGVCLDTARSGLVRLLLPDGQSMVFGMDSAGRLIAAPIRTSLLDAESVAQLPPFPEAWLANCQDDWLVKEIRSCLTSGIPFQHAVAVGCYARLRTPGPGQGLQMMTDLVEGRIDEETDRPRRWARELEAGQVRTLERLAVADVYRLRQAVVDLDDTGSPREPGWKAQYLSLCHDRDDIEGIRLLLRTVGAGADIEIALDDLDGEAELLVAGIPIYLRLDDERLRRVTLMDPRAWWGQGREDQEG